MMKRYEQRRFGDLADEMAARYPEREALVFQNERYTFAEVSAEIATAAKALMALGVQPGEHVALWLNNSADWIFLSFALAKVGAVQVPVNTRFRTRDFEYVVRQSDSTMLITHNHSGPIDYLDMVREAVTLPSSGSAVEDPNLPELRR